MPQGFKWTACLMHKPSFAVEQLACCCCLPCKDDARCCTLWWNWFGIVYTDKPLSVGSRKLQGRAVSPCSTMRQQNANTWRTKQTLVAVTHNVVCSANWCVRVCVCRGAANDLQRMCIRRAVGVSAASLYFKRCVPSSKLFILS